MDMSRLAVTYKPIMGKIDRYTEEQVGGKIGRYIDTSVLYDGLGSTGSA